MRPDRGSGFADEVDETIVVDISSVTKRHAIGHQQVTATITDDDGPTNFHQQCDGR